MTLTFRQEPPLWHAATDSLRFFAENGETTVLCGITREGLGRLAGIRLSGEADCRWTFDAYRPVIETLARRKYAAGQVGPFQSLLLAADDVPRTKL